MYLLKCSFLPFCSPTSSEGKFGRHSWYCRVKPPKITPETVQVDETNVVLHCSWPDSQCKNIAKFQASWCSVWINFCFTGVMLRFSDLHQPMRNITHFISADFFSTSAISFSSQKEVFFPLFFFLQMPCPHNVSNARTVFVGLILNLCCDLDLTELVFINRSGSSLSQPSNQTYLGSKTSWKYSVKLVGS